MVSTKQIKLAFALSAILGLLLNSACFAADVDPTDEQRAAISKNCTHILESLQQLQHVDSRTRTYLGTAYESISSRFMTPLNLRLVKLGKPSVLLFDIQNNFTTTQSQFRERYVEYMRSLESLIATDCSAHPDDFYHNLLTVRQKRENLRLSTKDLAKLAEEQYQAVIELKENL